jgi:hypothetical protein
MGFKFNPFTGTLDTVDSPSGVFEELDVNGDITLDDGGTYTTTLQTITATANRTISLPDATGTVALVAGSSGQLVYNNAGAQAGAPGSVVGATGDVTLTLNGAASTPPLDITGTWFTGGTSTTTKPQVLIEPTGTTSTAWSTSGTGLGVNAASGFAGNLLDLQRNGTSRAVVTGAGQLLVGTASARASDGITPTYFQEGASGGPTYEALAICSNAGSSTANAGAYILLSRSRGTTLGSSASVASGDLLGAIRFYGADGTDIQTPGAGIAAEVDGTPGANDMPGRLVFSTTADGAASTTERMRIKSTGVINFSNAPTYADNTAALAGGLVAGDVYKTSAGDLRITV